MSDNNRNTNFSIGKTLDYLRNLLTGQERNALERSLERDAFERDALEGFQFLKPDELETDLKDLNKKLSRRVNKSTRVLIYRMAAGVAIILSLSISYLTVFNKQINKFPENLQVSESVEKKEKAVDKSIKDPLEMSKQMEIGPIENDISEAETLPVNEEPVPENIQAIRSEIVKADAETYTSIETLDDMADEDVAEVTLEFSDENEMAITGQTIEEIAYQSDIEEEVTAKSENISEPVAETFDFEMPIERSSSRAKKSVAPSPVSNEISAMNTDEVGSPILSNTISYFVLEELAIIDSNEEKDTKDYVPASPETSMRRYRKYIEDNLRIPISGQDTQKTIVILNFIVNENGKTEQFRIIESPDTKFSTEVIRAVEEGPLWNPAKRSGVYSQEETSLKIVFIYNALD